MGMASSEATYFSRMQVCSFVPLRSNKATVVKKACITLLGKGNHENYGHGSLLQPRKDAFAPDFWLY